MYLVSIRSRKYGWYKIVEDEVGIQTFCTEHQVSTDIDISEDGVFWDEKSGCSVTRQKLVVGMEWED